MSAMKKNPPKNSQSKAKADARYVKTATTPSAASEISESTASCLNCSEEFTGDSAGAVGDGRQSLSITSTNGTAIRGVLCQQCNTGIGLLGDDLEGALKAVEYLRRYEARKTTTTNSRG